MCAVSVELLVSFHAWLVMREGPAYRVVQHIFNVERFVFSFSVLASLDEETSGGKGFESCTVFSERSHWSLLTTDGFRLICLFNNMLPTFSTDTFPLVSDPNRSTAGSLFGCCCGVLSR